MQSWFPDEAKSPDLCCRAGGRWAVRSAFLRDLRVASKDAEMEMNALCCLSTRNFDEPENRMFAQ